MIVSLVGRTISGSSSFAAGRAAACRRARLEPVMRDDGTLLGEPLDVLGLLLQKAHRDEERKIGVLVPGLFERAIEAVLHVFPDAMPHGRMTMQPRTGETSANSAALITC